MNNRWLVEKIFSTASDYPADTFSTKNRLYTCINPYSYHLLRKNMSLYQHMDGIFVDGMTMCWWIRLLWGYKIPRLSFDMTSIAAVFFEQLNKEGNSQSVFFIGAKQEQLSNSVAFIKAKYPHINVRGFRNGYFKDSNERQIVINRIIDLAPDYVIVGMGSPIQEQFLLDLKESGYKGISFTCGGFLHQTSYGVNYYPQWINKLNLRGAYRSFKEKGIAKRNYNTFLQFPYLFIVDTFKTKLGR